MSIPQLIKCILFLFLAPVLFARPNSAPTQHNERQASFGEVYTGTFLLANTSSKDKLLRITKADVALSSFGEPHYFSAGTMLKSNANWIDFSPEQLVLKAGEETHISYTVSVPDGHIKSGRYWSALLINEEDTEWDATKPRDPTKTAIQITTHVQRDNNFRLKIKDTRLVQIENRPAIEVAIENPSQRFLNANIWAEIYDQSGHYVERYMGQTVKLAPGQNTTTQIELDGLRVGKYKAILASRYTSPTGFSELQETALLAQYVAPFTLAISRDKSIKINQQDKPVMLASSSHKEDGAAKVPISALELDTEIPAARPDKDPGADLVAAQSEHGSQTAARGDSVESQIPSGSSSFPKRYHTVKKGEWLSTIAKKYYSDAMKFKLIFAANKAILENPNVIHPGQELWIPYEDDETIKQLTASAPITEENLSEPWAYHSGEALGWLAKTNKRRWTINDYCLDFVSTMVVPDSLNSYLTSSIKVERIKIPLPLSLSKFSGASGSLTFSGSNPSPSSLTLTSRRSS